MLQRDSFRFRVFIVYGCIDRCWEIAFSFRGLYPLAQLLLMWSVVIVGAVVVRKRKEVYNK